MVQGDGLSLPSRVKAAAVSFCRTQFDSSFVWLYSERVLSCGFAVCRAWTTRKVGDDASKSLRRAAICLFSNIENKTTEDFCYNQSKMVGFVLNQVHLTP